MQRSRLVLVLGALVAPLVGGLVAAAPAVADATPAMARGDIAGFVASPGAQITQSSVTIVVPTIVTSPDCNSGNFEYSLFGLRFDANTFVDVSANCGNSGNLAYFCDMMSGGHFNLVVVKPGQRITLAMNVHNGTTTVSMTRGLVYRHADGTPAPFSQVAIGGWYEPGFDIPVLTTDAHFTQAKVNNTPLFNVPSTQYALYNGSHVLLRPTTLNRSSNFTVRYVQQS